MSSITENNEKIETKTDLQKFVDRVNAERARFNAIVNWHTELYAHSNGVVPLPYGGDNCYNGLTVSEYKTVHKPTDENPDATDYENVVDIQASLARIAAVAKFAVSKKADVEKKYDDAGSFELIITIPGPNDRTIKLYYSVSRETVCEKKVTGQKVIPASFTPEKIVDVVEWDCKPVSLLGFDASAE